MWELEAGIGVLLFLIALPALSFVVVRYAYRTYGRLAPMPTFVALWSALYAFGLLAFTLFPIPASSEEACRTGPLPWRANPLDSFSEVFDAAGELGIGAFLTSHELLQIVMNVLLFAPLGALIGWRTRKSLAFATGAAVACSLAVELTQGTGVWGIYDCSYRYADVQDLLTNTLGAVLGWFVGRKLLVHLPWPARTASPGQRSPAEMVPGVGRRFTATMLDLVAIVMLGVALQILVGSVAQWIDPETDPASWPPAVAVLLATALPAFVFGVAMPMVRRDRAGPGAWTTFLSSRRNDDLSPTVGQMVVRAAVRWTPFVVLSIGGTLPTVLFVALAGIQLVVVVFRRDHASLAGLASGTRSVICPFTATGRTPGRSPADLI